MKKFTILLLALLLCFSAGCGKSAPEESAPEATSGVSTVPVADTRDTIALETEQATTEPVDDGLVPVWHLEKQISVDGNGYNYSYAYTYDESGAETRRDVYIGNGHLCYFTYTYDEAGNETSRTQHESDGNENWTYVYAYDANGNKIEYARYEYGELTEKSLYAYNEQGDLEKSDYYYGADDDDPTTDTYKYVYLEDGKVASRTQYHGVNENNTRKYTYHENGNIAREESWFDNKLTAVWTFNEDGKIVETERYMTRNSVTTVSRWVYSYDESGNMTEMQIYENDQLTEHYNYTYIQVRIPPEKVDIAVARQQELLQEHQ